VLPLPLLLLLPHEPLVLGPLLVPLDFLLPDHHDIVLLLEVVLDSGDERVQVGGGAGRVQAGVRLGLRRVHRLDETQQREVFQCVVVDEVFQQLVRIAPQVRHHVVLQELAVVEVVESPEVHRDAVVQPHIMMLVHDVVGVQVLVQRLNRQPQLLSVAVHRELAKPVVEVVSHLLALEVTRRGLVEVKPNRLVEFDARPDYVDRRSPIVSHSAFKTKAIIRGSPI
jgi:hypothetical protein